MFTQEQKIKNIEKMLGFELPSLKHFSDEDLLKLNNKLYQLNETFEAMYKKLKQKRMI